MQRNAKDEKQIGRAEEQQKLDVKRRKEDVYFVMGDPKGRRILWDILEFTGVFSVGWDPSAKIHFNAGMRNVGLRLFQELHQVCPDLYLLMAKEAAEAVKKRQELDDALIEADNGEANG
jgi:hypothetical protein